MFQELQPLLANRSMVLILTSVKEGIQVNFIPKATDDDKDADKALLTPLTITGTAEELDRELPAALTDYTASYKTIAEQIEEGKKAMEAAAKEAKAAAKSNTKVASPAKKVEATKPAAKPEPEEEAAPSLFGAETEVFEG